MRRKHLKSGGLDTNWWWDSIGLQMLGRLRYVSRLHRSRDKVASRMPKMAFYWTTLWCTNTTMFMVLSSWLRAIATVHPVQVPTNPHTKPYNLCCEAAGRLLTIHIPSPFICITHSRNADTHYTVRRRVEGWVDLGGHWAIAAGSACAIWWHLWLGVAVLLSDETATVSGSTLTAVGRFQLLALWPGTHSQILSGIQRAAQTVLGVLKTYSCSRVTSASSALGVLNDYALYKSRHSLTHSIARVIDRVQFHNYCVQFTIT